MKGADCSTREQNNWGRKKKSTFSQENDHIWLDTDTHRGHTL